MRDKNIVILVAATFLATLIGTSALFLAQPLPDTIQVNSGLVPIDMYPVNVEGWVITVNFGGYLNTSYTPPLQCDYWIATKGAAALESPTLSGLIRQINQIKQK